MSPLDFNNVSDMTEEELDVWLLFLQSYSYDFSESFKTTYSQYKEKEGQSFRLLKIIHSLESGGEHDVDLENFPMFLIEFADKKQILAWPDEVLKKQQFRG